MANLKALLLGCGNDRTKKVKFPTSDWCGELVTIDMNPNCGATLVRDLEERPLPFDAGTFGEIHAYDVLEHLGRYGDWRGWFDEMSEYERLLAPGGFLGFVVPTGADADADPGHTRRISQNWFSLLDQRWYDAKLAIEWQVTDYRWYWKGQLTTIFAEQIEDHHLAVVLKKGL